MPSSSRPSLCRFFVTGISACLDHSLLFCIVPASVEHESKEKNTFFFFHAPTAIPSPHPTHFFHCVSFLWSFSRVPTILSNRSSSFHVQICLMSFDTACISEMWRSFPLAAMVCFIPWYLFMLLSWVCRLDLDIEMSIQIPLAPILEAILEYVGMSFPTYEIVASDKVYTCKVC